MSLRSQTIKLAASMPVGSPERRALLAAVKDAGRLPKLYQDAKTLGLRLEKQQNSFNHYKFDRKKMSQMLDSIYENLQRLSETFYGSPSFGGDEEEAADDRSLLIQEILGSIQSFRAAAYVVESLCEVTANTAKMLVQTEKLVGKMR